MPAKKNCSSRGKLYDKARNAGKKLRKEGILPLKSSSSNSPAKITSHDIG